MRCSCARDRKIKILRVARGQYAKTTPLFGGFVIAKRGWVFADASIAGRRFRVITTHLESFNDESNVAQGRELATDPGLRTAAPTVLLGDFNSRADGSTTPTYANLLAAGFRDAWVQARPNDVGLTCCFGEDLRELERAVLQPHRLRARAERLPRRRRRNRRRGSSATASPASGRRITPVSGPGCGCPS